MSYVLSCCSTADLSKEIYNKRNISFIPFHFQINGEEYRDDGGDSMPLDRFYSMMAEGAETKTSQVNADEFEEYFEGFLSQGMDVLHVSLSSGLSGVVNSAMIAKGNLEEKYPDRKILVVDSLGASCGYGLLMCKAADLRDEGKSIDEVYDFIENNKLYVHHWFFSTDLTYYIKGGRVTKTAGFVGNMLNICPLLDVDYEGKLIPRFKIRTRKKVVQATLEQMEKFAERGLDYSQSCFISHAGDMEDAILLKDAVETKFPALKDKVEILPIGTTIGSHTGPGTVALFFWGTKRDN